MTFEKAVKHAAKLRMALIGPAGSGKTYTALNVAQHLGKRIALVDTEHGSASKYADLFNFDTLAPDTFSPQVYIDAIHAAEQAGYDVLILDSLSHAWTGKEGALELVDKAAKRSQSANTFAAWRDVTPLHNRMIDTILAARLHVIATMRTKTEYVIETNEKGKQVPRKVGTQPVQRDGLEYEFDVIADLDADNNLIVGKTRCPALNGAMFSKAGQDIADVLKAWLTGAPMPERPKVQRAPEAPEPGKANGNGHTQPAIDPNARPWAPDVLRNAIANNVANTLKKNPAWEPELCTEAQRGLLVSKLNEVWAGDANADHNRHSLLFYLLGNDSAKAVTKAQAKVMLDWLVSEKDDSGDNPLKPLAVQEAQAIIRLVLADAGQTDMFAEGEAVK